MDPCYWSIEWLLERRAEACLEKNRANARFFVGECAAIEDIYAVSRIYERIVRKVIA